MKNRLLFQKNYTRDTSLFVQEIWANNQSLILPKLLGKENPHLPGIAHYVNNGSVEIWEHKEATGWLLESILEKNNADPHFFDEQMKIHEEVLREIRQYWDKKVLSTKEEVIKVGELFAKGISGFNIFFRTAQNDKTPQGLREKALAMREKDTFFSQNDILLQASIGKLFPETLGYENYVLASEIENLPSVEILRERKKHFLLVDGSERFAGSLVQYEEKHREYHFEQEHAVTDLKEIRGQIAHKGKVQGVVKIILRREQNTEVMEGDILVSPMTTPDFLPAMQKAAAFVTDEGGITCHAAIVAREMKKPCIIGTKFATQILKDGMMVEVDADNGIVKIVS